MCFRAQLELSGMPLTRTGQRQCKFVLFRSFLFPRFFLSVKIAGSFTDADFPIPGEKVASGG